MSLTNYQRGRVSRVDDAIILARTDRKWIDVDLEIYTNVNHVRNYCKLDHGMIDI